MLAVCKGTPFALHLDSRSRILLRIPGQIVIELH